MYIAARIIGVLLSQFSYLVQCVKITTQLLALFASFLLFNEITVTHVHPDIFHWHSRVSHR